MIFIASLYLFEPVCKWRTPTTDKQTTRLQNKIRLHSLTQVKRKRNALHAADRDLHYLSESLSGQNKHLDEVWRCTFAPKNPVLALYSAAAASLNIGPTFKIVIHISHTHTHTRGTIGWKIPKFSFNERDNIERSRKPKRWRQCDMVESSRKSWYIQLFFFTFFYLLLLPWLKTSTTGLIYKHLMARQCRAPH